MGAHTFATSDCNIFCPLKTFLFVLHLNCLFALLQWGWKRADMIYDSYVFRSQISSILSEVYRLLYLLELWIKGRRFCFTSGESYSGLTVVCKPDCLSDALEAYSERGGKENEKEQEIKMFLFLFALQTRAHTHTHHTSIFKLPFGGSTNQNV